MYTDPGGLENICYTLLYIDIYIYIYCYALLYIPQIQSAACGCSNKNSACHVSLEESPYVHVSHPQKNQDPW